MSLVGMGKAGLAALGVFIQRFTRALNHDKAFSYQYRQYGWLLRGLRVTGPLDRWS